MPDAATLGAVRLAKYLAAAGIASRRATEQLVRAGRVAVDGTTMTDPAHDVQPDVSVTLDGSSVEFAHRRLVYAVNKPPGVVSTARDPHGRPAVVDLIQVSTRLYPVGRLDIDTTGLILLTNDGELAHRLTHPSFQVEKTYRATVGGPVREAALLALRGGVELEDGRTAPARVRRLSADTLEITIHEGRKRQIKRMCEAVGHPVKRLERVAIGPLALGRLRPGDYRLLSEAEVEALSAAAGGRPGAASSRSESASAPRD